MNTRVPSTSHKQASRGLSSNGSPSGGEDASAPPSSRRDLPKKRNRAALSCVACRERKIKCDRQLPCDQCIKRGDDDLCFLDPYKRGPPAAQSKSAKVQAQLQEQAKQQAERDRQRAAAAASATAAIAQQSRQIDEAHLTQQQQQQVRPSLPFYASQPHHPSYATPRLQQSLAASQYAAAPPTVPSRHSDNEVEAIKARLAQLEAALSASGRSPSGQASHFSPNANSSISTDSPPFLQPHQAHQTSDLPPLAGMLGASSPASHTLSSWRHPVDETARLAPLRSASNQLSSAGDSPSSQASSTRSNALYTHPRYQESLDQYDQQATKHPRLSSPHVPDSDHRALSVQPQHQRGELDSDTEDAAMVLEGLAMSGKSLRPDEKAPFPANESNADPVTKEPQETLTMYVARNREKDIMLDVSQGGTSGPTADEIVAPQACSTKQCDADGPSTYEEALEMERNGIDVSPAKKACLRLKDSTSLFRPIFGPESYLGFGMGWAFPAAEAANDLHVKGGQCPGSAQREAVLRAMIRVLPRRQLAAQLVSVYADRVNFLAGNIVHIPSFRRDVEAFYALETVEKQARVVNNVDAGWLAVYLLVIVLALRFYPCVPPEDWEPITHFFDGRTIHLYGSAARTALVLARYQSSRSLAVLQAILLFNLADSHSGRCNPTMLRTAISNAQEMGLHRLGDASRQPKPGESSSLIIRREIAKRIWYQLVFKDWSYSCKSLIYSIQDKQFNTPLPSNYNDEDLEKVPLPDPKPREEYTEMSYTIESHEVVKVLKLRTDLINEAKSLAGETGVKHGACSQAAIVDRAFRDLLDNLPSFFSVGSEVGANTNVEIQRWLLQQGVFHHLLKLHRPALASKREARLCCVVLARSILDTQKKLRSRCTVVDRLIGNLAQSYTAAIVLLLDLLQPQDLEPGGEAARRDVIRSEVAEALRALHHVNETTNCSESGIKVIEALLAEEQTRWDARQVERKHPGLKRTRSGERQPKSKDMLRLAHRIARATQGDSSAPISKPEEGKSEVGPSIIADHRDGEDALMEAIHEPTAQQETDKDAVSRALMEQLLVPQAAALKHTYTVPAPAAGGPMLSATFDSLGSSGSFDMLWNSSSNGGIGTDGPSGENADTQFFSGPEAEGFDLKSFLAAYDSPGQSSSTGSHTGRGSLSAFSMDESSNGGGGNGGTSSCNTSVYGQDNNPAEGITPGKSGYFSPVPRALSPHDLRAHSLGANGSASGSNDSPQFPTNGNPSNSTQQQTSGNMNITPASQVAPSPYGLDAFYNWVLSQAVNTSGGLSGMTAVPSQQPLNSSSTSNMNTASNGALMSNADANSTSASSTYNSINDPFDASSGTKAVGNPGIGNPLSHTTITGGAASTYNLSNGGNINNANGGGSVASAYIDFLAPFGGPPQNTWPSSDPSASSAANGKSGSLDEPSGLDTNGWTSSRSANQGQSTSGGGGGIGIPNLGTPSASLAPAGEAASWLSGPGLFDFVP